jgi:glycosyltransferase involved in cell wall biosynthesis
MTSGAPDTSPIIAISRYGIDGASSRVRLHQWFAHSGLPSEYHDYLGTADNQIGTIARRLPQAIDAEIGLRRLSRRVAGRTVILSKEASPFSSGGIEAKLLVRAGHGVYDFDDALYADTAGRFAKVWSKRETWIRSVRAADVVIAGSEILAEAAGEYSGNVVMIPSCIEPDEYVLKTDYEIHGAPRAVWIGSASTEAFLRELAEPLLVLQDRYGLRVTVISSGDGDLGALAPMVDRVAWSRTGFAAELAAADFGLMPLADTPYTRGKCSYKLLQYAATGLPLIGSPVGANEGVLKRLGGLAATDAEEWVSAAAHVIDLGVADRAALGASMRSGVVDGFSYGRWNDTWVGLLVP